MLKKLKVVSAVLAAAMLFGNSAYAAELSAEAIWDGSYLTVKGKLEQGNNNEFGIIITTPEEKISVYQNTGESDGSFQPEGTLTRAQAAQMLYKMEREK